jgi:hypothetical protein
VNPKVEVSQLDELWGSLWEFQNVLAWSKAYLGCCLIREHLINTQGFLLATIFNHLSFWEEGEVKRQSESLIQMGKMHANNSKYTCKVILLTKHDGSKILFGDYRPLN